MSDDLVKRLRTRSVWLRGLGGIMRPDADTDEQAADRIERLEAALRKIAQHDLQAIALDALHPDVRIALREETNDR